MPLLHHLNSTTILGQVTVVVTIYNNLNEYMRSPEEKAQIFEENTNQINEYNVVQRNENQSQTEHVVNSNVLSASMNERNENAKLSEPVTFTLKHKDVSTVLLYCRCFVVTSMFIYLMSVCTFQNLT